MSPIDFALLMFAIAILAGFIGSIVGIGGGAVIVPVLTILFHFSIRIAIGASIVSVIATSSGAAVAYVKDQMTNLRLGMFLEIGTTIGALSGALLTTLIPDRYLFLLFGLILVYSALLMAKQPKDAHVKIEPDAFSKKLRLKGSYFDKATNKTIQYFPTNSVVGLSLMYVAGLISALLGIGSGALKVPAMDVAMKVPLKASSATSNFMIGVTAAASAGVYFAKGEINPIISGPVALGILLGAIIGSRILPKINSAVLRYIFVFVLVIISVEMVQRGLR